MDDEWSLLSNSYEDILLPRFELFYRFIGNIIIDYIKHNKKDQYKIVDYGTGPGEPLLTIVKLIKENNVLNVKFEGIDSSIGMISLAKQRLNKLNLNDFNVDFNISNYLPDNSIYDIIISSLVLPYISDKINLIKEFSKHLNNDGLLITCHWPNPNQVPFLSLLKRINIYMSDGEEISLSNLETNVSFSCSNEETTKQMFIDQGFIIKEFISIELPMLFPDIRTFLSFSRVASWFNDEELFLKAKKQTQKILHEEYGFKPNFDDSFQLQSNVIIIVASK